MSDDVIINQVIEGYRVQIRAGRHPMAGADCIPSPHKYRDLPHMNFEIYESAEADDPAFNLHMGQYNDGGRTCRFAWENEIDTFEFCLNSCLDDIDGDSAEEFVSNALNEFVRQAQEVVEDNGGAATTALEVGLAGILAIGVKVLVDLIVAAWLTPIVPPPL